MIEPKFKDLIEYSTPYILSYLFEGSDSLKILCHFQTFF